MDMFNRKKRNCQVGIIHTEVFQHYTSTVTIRGIVIRFDKIKTVYKQTSKLYNPRFCLEDIAGGAAVILLNVDNQSCDLIRLEWKGEYAFSVGP
jgi:hypothetical protein